MPHKSDDSGTDVDTYTHTYVQATICLERWSLSKAKAPVRLRTLMASRSAHAPGLTSYMNIKQIQTLKK